jgi:hypothetical protein
MPKSLGDLILQLNDEVPSKAEMLEDLGVDTNELCRALENYDTLLETASEHRLMQATKTLLDWGIAIGYSYACQKYRKPVETK